MSLYLTHTSTVCSTETEFFEDIAHPQRVHWLPKTYEKAKTGFTYAPHLLADMVLRPEKISWIRENPSIGKTAFILAGGNQHFAGINARENQKHTRLHYVYKFLPFSLTNVYAGRMAQQICEPDYITTDATACVSSLKVLMDCQMLEQYGYTRFVILSVEDAVSNSVLEFFGDSGASLTKKREDEERVLPSAFDSKNGGFYVGQGAVFAVLMTEKEVNHYGLTPRARLMGAYHCAEREKNAIGQREDGEGYSSAIEGALYYSQTNRRDITIVKSHGTGTKSNNASEKNGLLRSLDDFIATSYKQKIGHTMGASGLLETILLLDNLAYGVVPGIPNRTEEDNVFLSQDCEAPDGLVLSLAAGMGNVYTAAIFEPVGHNMAQMVDSQQQELSVEDIIGIAGMNTDAGVSQAQLINMINAELKMPDTLFLRQGNTVFIIHKAQPRVGFFRALNADTAPNFLQNGTEFIKACYKMGFDTMATEFTDPTVLSVFRYISNNPPNPNMGYQVQKTGNGGFYVTVQCGPRRGA